MSLLRVDGSWPGPVTISAGWFRARARPWNNAITEPMVRLERGGAEFLRSVSRELGQMGASSVYSPALYPDSTGVWRRSGYEPHAELAVMERSLLAVPDASGHDITPSDSPNWEAILRIDRASFDGFWGMSELGLREAYETSRSTTLLEATVDSVLAGYAIVGNQWGVSYLHRIAVHPDLTGQGLGSALVGESVSWGRAHGARSMVLNVRDVNEEAQRLYERCGFTHTGTRLAVLRHQPC